MNCVYSLQSNRQVMLLWQGIFFYIVKVVWLTRRARDKFSSYLLLTSTQATKHTQPSSGAKAGP